MNRKCWTKRHGATLRLFLHDCFVEGCDASIMISSPNGDAEKDYSENLSLAGDGFDTVIEAKQAVEAECPGVVSCADIVALAARDVVALVGGPSFNVELGRRDGLVSKASQCFSHCDRFANRLYSFSQSSPVDPSLNSDYAKQLMDSCPQNADPTVAITLDPETPQIFDNVYYQNLVAGKGLLSSDQVLYTDSASQSTVIEFAKNSGDFNGAFSTAMRKLGRVGIKTGNKGEIRKDCTTFNS
ncbi:Peroxidase [Quillaja saponaria]|uniref:peroxidase n=1 Tax=Quillaja saponaria TaxID=32244 RepID=A0AAD7KPA4_QUISA|nr:Peroxidase [Quillaja saponaria]